MTTPEGLIPVRLALEAMEKAYGNGVLHRQAVTALDALDRFAQEAPAPEGLRAALDAAIEAGCDIGDYSSGWIDGDAAWKAFQKALAATPPAPAEPTCNTPTCNRTCHNGPFGPCACQEPADWREVEPDAPVGFLHCEADGCGYTIDHATAMR